MWSSIKFGLSLVVVAWENYHEWRRQKKRDQLERDIVGYVNDEFGGVRDDNSKTDTTDIDSDTKR